MVNHVFSDILVRHILYIYPNPSRHFTMERVQVSSQGSIFWVLLFVSGYSVTISFTGKSGQNSFVISHPEAIMTNLTRKLFRIFNPQMYHDISLYYSLRNNLEMMLKSRTGMNYYKIVYFSVFKWQPSFFPTHI